MSKLIILMSFIAKHTHYVVFHCVFPISFSLSLQKLLPCPSFLADSSSPPSLSHLVRWSLRRRCRLNSVSGGRRTRSRRPMGGLRSGGRGRSQIDPREERRGEIFVKAAAAGDMKSSTWLLRRKKSLLLYFSNFCRCCCCCCCRPSPKVSCGQFAEEFFSGG